MAIVASSNSEINGVLSVAFYFLELDPVTLAMLTKILVVFIQFILKFIISIFRDATVSTFFIFMMSHNYLFLTHLLCVVPVRRLALLVGKEEVESLQIFLLMLFC